MCLNPKSTEVYDTYWRFAAERLAVYFRRLSDPLGPWSCDPILSEYRFTNVYRVTDRVSQYLVKEIQYGAERSRSPSEVFFRTILFKIFNRISTWEALEYKLGPISWQSTDIEKIAKVLDDLIRANARIYSAAYIMPSPGFGHQRKHLNHLALLDKMMRDGLPGQLSSANNLKSAYEMILTYSGLGPFLAFQYVIDLNYSPLINFSEMDFVVAGPGALDGISKCFENSAALNPSDLIRWVAERQDEEFAYRGLQFDGLFGRRMQLIDCQNVFCEISKYARVAHPDVAGMSGRKRIKQRYKPSVGTSLQIPFFPPKWHLGVDVAVDVNEKQSISGQLKLL